MDILGIGFPELVFIMIIAMMIFGPRRLPELAGKAGKFIADLRNMSQGLMAEWQREIAVAARMEELEKARQELQEIQQELKQIPKDIAAETATIKTTLETNIIAPPRPAPATPAPAPTPEPVAETAPVEPPQPLEETEVISAPETDGNEAEPIPPQVPEIPENRSENGTLRLAEENPLLPPESSAVAEEIVSTGPAATPGVEEDNIDSVPHTEPKEVVNE